MLCLFHFTNTFLVNKLVAPYYKFLGSMFTTLEVNNNWLATHIMFMMKTLKVEENSMNTKMKQMKMWLIWFLVLKCKSVGYRFALEQRMLVGCM